MISKKQSKSAKSSVGLNCERCGAAIVPIVYGYPSGSMFRDAARGKVALGGCVIMGNDPRWKCTASCELENNDEEIDS